METRHWFLTWTCYGNRLPGDDRGFVSDLRNDDNKKYRHNQQGTACDAAIPQLREYARQLLKCDPIRLNHEQAIKLRDQFEETSRIRKWVILAGAIMADHVHLVIEVIGDPEPEDILRDYKSYGSGKLNRIYGKPKSDTWWTESGSKRKLKTTDEINNKVKYVRDQPYALVVWGTLIDLGERGGVSPPVQ